MKKQMMKSAAVFSAAFLFLSAQTLSAQNSSGQTNDYSRVEELLTGWLANDLELQKTSLNAQSKALSLSSAKINNGVNVTLSTGNVSITTDVDSNTRITVNPAVSVDVPMVSDGEINLSVPATIDGKEDEKYVSNGSLSATVGIISGSAKQRKVTLLEAERTLTEANRAVTDRALTAEKEFYQSLKKLYNYAVSIHSAKNDLFEDQLSLRVLETQGYSKTSAKYRQAQLKVESDRRTVQEQQRIFERETAIFAVKCGKEFERTTSAADGKLENGQREADYDPVAAGEAAYVAALAFLPDSIPAVKDEKIFDYDQNLYTKTESAQWTKFINELKREADMDMTLKATGEYKLNSSQSGYDDAGGKLTFDWKGISASAGAYVPTGANLFNSKTTVEKNDNPYFQFGITVKPSEWRLSKIEKQQDQIDRQLEDIALQDAKDDYNTEVLSKVSSFHDIKWSERSYAEEFDMYTKLTSDMENWLKQGIVTESDYLDAKNNMEKARINVMINAIDLIVFNNEVKLLFCKD